MVSCAVRSCLSRRGVDQKSSGITFHRFPKNSVQREAWVKFVGRRKWQPARYSMLCSKHFSSIYFDRTSPFVVRLRPDAVPTLNDITHPLLYQDQVAVPILTQSIVQQALSKSYQDSTQEIKTEPSDTMQDNVDIKIEDDSSTDSADERGTLKLKNSMVADEAEKQAEYIARRTLEQNKEKMRSLHRKSRLLKRKIEKINNIFDELGKQCNINEVAKQLSSIPSSSNPIAEDSSTDSDVDKPYRLDKNIQENLKVNVVTNKDVAVADNEEAATQINCYNMESQVQVTFLAGSDTAKESLLKRKLKQLAENDVIKSKKIRELHNIVLVKNKLIAELKSEIAQLKKFQKNQ